MRNHFYQGNVRLLCQLTYVSHCHNGVLMLFSSASQHNDRETGSDNALLAANVSNEDSRSRFNVHLHYFYCNVKYK